MPAGRASQRVARGRQVPATDQPTGPDLDRLRAARPERHPGVHRALVADALLGGPASLPSAEWIARCQDVIAPDGPVVETSCAQLRASSRRLERSLSPTARGWLVRRTEATIAAARLDEVRRAIRADLDGLAVGLLERVIRLAAPFERSASSLHLGASTTHALSASLEAWSDAAPGPALLTSLQFIECMNEATDDLSHIARLVLLHALDAWLCGRLSRGRSPLHPLSPALHALWGSSRDRGHTWQMHVALGTETSAVLSAMPDASPEERRPARLAGVPALPHDALAAAWSTVDEGAPYLHRLVAELARWDALHACRRCAEHLPTDVIALDVGPPPLRHASGVLRAAADAHAAGLALQDQLPALRQALPAGPTGAWAMSLITAAARGLRTPCVPPSVHPLPWLGVDTPTERAIAMDHGLTALDAQLHDLLPERHAQQARRWTRHVVAQNTVHHPTRSAETGPPETEPSPPQGDRIFVSTQRSASPAAAATEVTSWRGAFPGPAPAHPMSTPMRLATPQIEQLLRNAGFPTATRAAVGDLWHEAVTQLTIEGDPTLLAAEAYPRIDARLTEAKEVRRALRVVIRRAGELFEPVDAILAVEACRALIDAIEQISLSTVMESRDPWLATFLADLRSLPADQAVLRLVVRPSPASAAEQWRSAVARAEPRLDRAELALLRRWGHQVTDMLSAPSLSAHVADLDAEERSLVYRLRAACRVPKNTAVSRAELVVRAALASPLRLAPHDDQRASTARIAHALAVHTEEAHMPIVLGAIRQLQSALRRYSELNDQQRLGTSSRAALFADCPAARRRWGLERLVHHMGQTARWTHDDLVCRLTGWPTPYHQDGPRLVSLASRFQRAISPGAAQGSPSLSLDAQRALRHILVSATVDTIVGPRRDQLRRWREHLEDAGLPRLHHAVAVNALHRVVAQCYGRRHGLVLVAQDVALLMSDVVEVPQSHAPPPARV